MTSEMTTDRPDRPEILTAADLAPLPEFTSVKKPFVIEKIPEYHFGTEVPAQFTIPRIKLTQIALPHGIEGRASPGELTDDFLDNIRSRGVVSPIEVAPLDEAGKFLLVAGRRRYRASAELGLLDIPVVVRLAKSNKDIHAGAIAENHFRKEVDTFDYAVSIETAVQDGMTPTEIAKEMGITEASVSQYRKILKLPGNVLEWVKDGALGKHTFSKCRAIGRLASPDMQSQAAELARVVDSSVIVSIVDAIKKTEDLKLAPSVIDLVLTAALEPDTLEKLQVLAKVPDFETQAKLARTAARKEAEVEDIKAWVRDVLVPDADVIGDDEETPKNGRFDTAAMKPPSKDRLLKLLLAASEKESTLKKIASPTDSQRLKIAHQEGVLAGLRRAAGLPMNQDD